MLGPGEDYDALLWSFLLAFEQAFWNYVAKFWHFKAILMICWPISNLCWFKLRGSIGHLAPALNQPKAVVATILKLCSAILIYVRLITFERPFVQQIRAALNSLVCVIFEIYWSPILEAPRHGRLMLDENHPMLIRCINMCIFFNMFAVCWKTKNFYPKRRPGDATLLFIVVLMFVLCEHLTPKYLLIGVAKLINATVHNSFL